MKNRSIIDEDEQRKLRELRSIFGGTKTAKIIGVSSYTVLVAISGGKISHDSKILIERALAKLMLDDIKQFFCDDEAYAA